MLDEGEFTFSGLVETGALGHGSLARILERDERGRLKGQNVKLEMLDRLAEALDLDPWQLLHPDGDCADFSEQALRIARKMDSLAPEARNRAYAMFVQMVDFGNVPKPEDGSSDPDTPKPRRLRRVAR
jgi:hypothetical protein